jgi:hypothetical protein
MIYTNLRHKFESVLRQVLDYFEMETATDSSLVAPETIIGQN